MECFPFASVEIANAAFPLLSVTVANVAEPSLNVTDPVGVPERAGLTLAVKVKLVPWVEGFREDDTEVEVADACTTCTGADEVLAESSGLPP
jgi:hypothetical protein